MSQRDRRYSDEEVALILRKASQLEARVPGDAGGLSLHDIQRIAEEVGIDPDLVSQAAQLIHVPQSGGAAALFGGPTSYRAEVETSGALPREQFGEVVDAIRRVMGQPGKTSDVLDALEWQTVGETSTVTIVVRPKDDATKIQVLGDRAPTGFLTFFGTTMIGVLVGVATGATLEPGILGGAAILGSSVGAGVLAGRAIWTKTTRGFRKKFATLLRTVTEEVERRAESNP